MRPFGIVERDPFFDDPSGLESIPDFSEVDRFLFQASPEPLNKDVVQVSATTIHPLPGSVCLHAREGRCARQPLSAS